MVLVQKSPFLLGRAEDCQLQLPYTGVSRHHARIQRSSDGNWQIEDLGSKNGTFVNGSAIGALVSLKNGDHLLLGNSELRVVLPEQVPSLAPVEDRSTSGAQKLSDGLVVMRGAESLQQQWIDAGSGTGATNKALARLKDMVEIAKALSTANTIEAIFDAVRDALFRDIKGIERLALLIDRKGTGELEITQAADIAATNRETLLGDQNWISRSICRKVFDERIAIKTGDAMSDARFEGKMSIVLKGIRSAMAVPVWGESGVIGVLYADAQLTIRDWQQSADDDLSFFSTLGNLVAYSVQRWLLQERLKAEESLRDRLARYHSPAVVQQMMAAGELAGDGRLMPVDREISIIFADIVGFTSMSERLSATAIAELLNAFFDEMLVEVFDAGGTLDKFIGDCIMAFFGAPETQEDHAQRAVRASIGMLERLRRLNAADALGERLQLRVAVHTGRAVVGDVGSAKRVDYTVLGSTINTAARMEGIAPKGGLAISGATYSVISNQDDFEAAGEHRFKGIERPVSVFTWKGGDPN